MPEHFTATDVAEYARCPRAWWYERHQELAGLDPHALAVRLDARRIILGRQAARDPEVQLIERLLDRRRRFAMGRTAHATDARRPVPTARAAGCLAGLALLAMMLAAALLVAL
jgi:hypothetical protein